MPKQTRGGPSRRRSGGGPQRSPSSAARRGKTAADAVAAGGSLPRWVREELSRVTPKQKLGAALEALEQAAAAFAQGQYRRAAKSAGAAKTLSPRDATVRELLGLSAYRLGRWDDALRELRAFRRLTGDTAHVPVEMDAARALDRPDEVAKGWQLLEELGGRPATMKEGRVVYGSFLLDSGRAREAWDVTNPGRMTAQPFEEDLRLWYVAARAAARLDDGATARKLLQAITEEDPGFPGLDELERTVAAAGA